MSRLTAGERAERLLAIVPWVAARDGVPIDEICERFDITRTRLISDLEHLWFVGTPPYTPADLIEVDIDDDRVWIRYAEAFRRPPRLTPEQGLALVAAAQSLQAVPGADPDGPLARGLAKLASALGVDGRVEVDLGSVPAELLDVLRRAVAHGEVLELDYYSHNRDARGRRVVEPHRLFVDLGAWYLVATCRSAGGVRTFRVDRIHEAVPTGEHTSTVPPDDLPSDAFRVGGTGGVRVVLDLAPSGRWILEHARCEVLDDRPDGTARVALIATGDAWLERLLLRLGPAATVIEGPPDLARTAASRILARYRSTPEPTSDAAVRGSSLHP